MKKVTLIIILILLSILSACEKEVVLDLETAQTRLVINAPIKWEKGTNGNHQKIKLSLTAGYYEPSLPVVTGATVEIQAGSGEIFQFTEQTIPGTYECFNFIPVQNETYTLKVIHDNQVYIGKDTLFPVTNFNFTTQSETGGINGDDYEVKAFFTDPEGIQNYYLTEQKIPGYTVPNYYSFNDKFFDGNQVFDTATDENLKVGDIITFTVYGVSEDHHEYCVKILNTIVGGPFQTIPGKIKGNMVNTTQMNNYPLGYFSTSQTTTITHIIQ